jgi:hypothetical protein
MLKIFFAQTGLYMKIRVFLRSILPLEIPSDIKSTLYTASNSAVFGTTATSNAPYHPLLVDGAASKPDASPCALKRV